VSDLPRMVRELPIGAEVEADLSQPLSTAAQAELARLFDEHYLLLFRGQKLSPEEHRRVAEHLGPVPDDYDGEPGVVEIALDGILGAAELSFHSDLSYDAQPHFGVSLHALDIEPEEGTSTEFVHAVRAYHALPAGTKERLQNLDAMHAFPGTTTGRSLSDSWLAEVPCATHPVVWPHYRSGDPVLYVNFQATAKILGVPEADSADLLDELFSTLYSPANTYSHRWRTGDVIFWDNRALQHARGNQSSVRRRTLQRLTLDTMTFLERYQDFVTRFAQRLSEDPAVAPTATPTVA
jgi:taurine dioxygenase